MTSPKISKVYILDLLERAVWTFGQGAAATLVLVWGGSGIDAEHLTDWSSWQKVISAAIVGGIAGLVSLVKSVVAGAVTGTASSSQTVAAATTVPTLSAPVIPADPSAQSHDAQLITNEPVGLPTTGAAVPTPQP